MLQKQTKTITQTKKIQTTKHIRLEEITEVIRKIRITQKQKDKKRIERMELIFHSFLKNVKESDVNE